MRQTGRAAILIWSVALAAAAEQDPAQVLERVTAKVRARSMRLPNYTCVETVTRDYYFPRAETLARPCPAVLERRHYPGLGTVLQLVMTDRLRLDVTMTGSGEIYSWVGASKFEDAGIDQVVHEGPIGTGAFGALLSIIFRQDAGTFHFEGKRVVDGRDVMEYSYHVSEKESRYQVKTADSWIHTAYQGTFQADPGTDEVVRVAVETVDLPAVTGSCRTSNWMDLGLVQIGSGRFLLPKLGRQRFVDMTGAEVENTTTIGECREFRGESTVNFGTDPGEAAEAAGASGGNGGLTALPPGLPFTFELTTPIVADTAAGGDPFSGRLAGALRDRKGKTVAPAHSLVKGRLLRVDNRRIAPLGSVVVLQLKTLEVGGVSIALTADRGGRTMRTPVLLPQPWERNAGAFGLPGDHAVMKAGFPSEWVTAAK